MMNNLLNLIVMGALVGTFVLAPTQTLVTPRDTDLDIPRGQVAVSQNDHGKSAAIAAIEAAGYENVRLLVRATNGSWRAKAQRTAAEVTVTVDGMGRVSVE